MRNKQEEIIGMSNKKNLLIYAHYYIPDTASTGQILRELAEGMLDKFNITVVCVVPSYLGTIEEKYKTQNKTFQTVEENIRTFSQPIENGKKNRIQVEKRTYKSKGLYVAAGQFILKQKNGNRFAKKQKGKRGYKTDGQAG